MQTCYGGVRFGFTQPSPRNVERLDAGAVPMVVAMMSRGLQVDLSHFKTMERTLADGMDEITEEVRRLTGYLVNLDSGPQVSDLLFKKLGLKQPRPRMTPSGDRESADEESLIAVQHDHLCVPKILDYKELSKLRGTYVKPMPKLARKTEDGTWRMIPNLGTTRVPSGRFNCNKPNMLAMPNRTALGRKVCEGFITQPQWRYLSVDFSQIEPRETAHRSLDPNLIRIYENDEDIYSDFAIRAFKLADTRYKDDTTGEWKYPTVHKKDHRFPSKTCILSAIYRISAKGLLEKMPILCESCGWTQESGDEHACPRFRAFWTEDRCQDIINAFLLTYMGIPKMWKADDAYTRQHSYIVDEFGRMMHVIAVRSVLQWVVNGALREAGNLPIQGSACGFLKLAMAEVFDVFEREGLDEVVHPLLPIHDEILFEVREDVAEEIGQLVVYIFERVVRLRVPIKAGVAMADNWGSLPK
jgi:DNA polymerase I